MSRTTHTASAAEAARPDQENEDQANGDQADRDQANGDQADRDQAGVDETNPAATGVDEADRDGARSDERAELIHQLQIVQDAFERRALSAWAEPLVTPSLTMQQLRVLTIIATDPAKATGQNLAALLRVSLASMSGIVDRLVDHGMVERTQDADDRRVRRLSVTDEGAAVIQGLLSSAGAMPAAVLQRLALADLRALVRGVTAVDRVTQELSENAEPSVSDLRPA